MLHGAIQKIKVARSYKPRYTASVFQPQELVLALLVDCNPTYSKNLTLLVSVIVHSSTRHVVPVVILR